MKRVFNPMLFLLANAPDVEKNLDLLMSMLQATTESVKNIKNGIDNFHATILNMASTAAGPSPTQAPPAWPNPPVQTPETAAKPEPSPEPVITLEPAPTIQMPAAKPPVS